MLLVVGGCIRNLIMGGEAHDWDITIQAIPEEISQTFKKIKVILMDRKFGTVIVVIMNYVNYKVSTFEGNNKE